MNKLFISFKSAAERASQNLDKLRRARRGNKLSRLLRPLLVHKQAKRVVGVNMVAILMASSALPQARAAGGGETELVIEVENKKIETEISMAWPTKSVTINQFFSLWHPGLDLEGVTGDPVVVVTKGVVKEVNRSKFAYGNSVVVQHGGETASLYAHLSRIEVQVGQVVNVSEKIGEIGSTGWSTGDHLHLEIRENGRAVNPLLVLPTRSRQ